MLLSGPKRAEEEGAGEGQLAVCTCIPFLLLAT